MRDQSFSAKANRISIILRVIAGLFCLGALLVPFSTGLTTKIQSEPGYLITHYGPAFSFLFGGTITAGHRSYTTVGVAVIGTIGYVLMACSLLSLIGYFLIRRNSKSYLLIACSALFGLISSFLLLFSHDAAATVLADSLVGRRSDSVVATMIRNTTLQFGFWGISLFGFIASTLSLASLVFDGSFDEARSWARSRRNG